MRKRWRLQVATASTDWETYDEFLNLEGALASYDRERDAKPAHRWRLLERTITEEVIQQHEGTE